MRRRLIGFLIALAMMSGFFAISTVPAAAVITCTTQQTHYGPWAYDGSTYVRSYVTVIPYLSGGCYYTYRFGAQAQNGAFVNVRDSGMSSFEYRAWVCGTVQYADFNSVYGGTNTYTTPRIWYGTCGPQVDNRAAYVWSVYYTTGHSHVGSYVSF